ncbi:polar amino acid transport system substrate-binding protein/lysine/arginine/ornithine transport system substrate-binding protein/histidine transport system substrate-binding protein [Ruegeria halocynthiae]|uniref:Polar amino acid transport system substrate-binding protein/lysine/arginine/ornithine transport system substrate-binding protein/histidine transport system substrate-binding protein n=1 Tax=Ruegeria halocynthiae TaxID=985054 RepID=A0A1H2ZPF0_9RHOB|nr:transporter substrate-binding domain-containing protein [Ruegeria halocynthiae]SDX18724.1 polar amino acid transport system substrate-binding protein/lysine/arginine/ornithine transport system substrate-binding protein/histidine transport system substrate-binding protein [Ruegeria halocynthiae]
MFKPLRKMTAISLLAIVSAGTASADDVIRFATEAAYPPFNERAADGSIVGWEIDLGQAMCAKMERKCEFVAQDWDGMIPGLLSNRFDGIFASMTITEERKQRIDFSDKYYQSPARFVAKDGAAIDRAASDLGGLKVGTISGVTECFLNKHYPDTETAIYRSSEDMFLDLQSGRLDAILSESVQADFGLIRENPDDGFAFQGGPALDAECFGEGIGIGVRKDDAELRAALNEAIAAVRADGTYDRLVEEYFGYDIYGE